LQKQGFVYVVTNKMLGTLYIGVTSNLSKRIYEHKQGFIDSFTKKYNLKKLVYYEIFDDIAEAINREKQLKKYKRDKKIELINLFNPNWKDLYESVII
jgi:putative endonuclease